MTMECHFRMRDSSRKSDECRLSLKQCGMCARTSGIMSNIRRRRVILFTCLALMMCCSFTTACNIDTTRPVIYKLPSTEQGSGTDYLDGLFGYTVLQHKTAVNTFILVGAPTAATYYNDAVERPGVLFQCYAQPPNSCFEINLDESGNTNPIHPKLLNRKDNAWIGVSLTRQPTKNTDELSDITVCGHRYANDYYVKDSIITVNTTFDPNDRFPNGICYTFGHKGGNLDIDKSDHVEISIPCAGVNQTDGINTRVHGWCQAGMSAHYTEDGNRIMLGAAGSYNWTGTVFEGDRVDRDFQPAPDAWGEDNDYIGYAVSSGRFISRDSVQGVTSAPRARLWKEEITEGKVIIYDLETHIVYQELFGEMMGTYFGAAIKALDLNNDTWSDLLVGAPLYAVEQDEGRVYVYINNGKGKLEPLDFKLSGSNALGARFGSAIAGAGDLNNDGFQDVVIGAPWEDDNSGAVYVYFGAVDGIQSQYSQRLAGADFVPGIKSFGLSLDGGTDVDLNVLPDIVVGAPASNRAILFKTRPVANMEVTLEMNPDPLDPEIQNCTLNGKPITCVTVTVCMYYDAVSTPTTMDMDIELTVDYLRMNDGRKARFYFLEGGTPTESIYKLVIARRSNTVCFSKEAYLETTTRDFLTPLPFHLYYGIHEYPFEEDPRGDNPHKFVGGLPPIIDEGICGNGTLIENLRFIRECGADAICQTDLQLTGEIIFPGGESFYILGAYSAMHVEFRVDNVGEEAHNAQVVIRHSMEIVFEALESSTSSCLTSTSCNLEGVVTCVPIQSQNNTGAVECTIGNPMKSSTSSSLRLRFDIGGVTYEHSQGFLDVSVEARTISTELDPSNNNFKPKIPVTVVADTAARGRSDPASVYFATNSTVVDDPEAVLTRALLAAGTISVKNMVSEYDVMDVELNNTEEYRDFDDEFIGPSFSLLSEASNEGPGRLPFDSVLYVSIPWRHSSGDWMVYIRDINTRGVPGTCNKKEVLDLQDLRMEEHYVNRTTSAVTVLETDHSNTFVVELSKNTKKLTCSNARCVTIQCNIDRPLQGGNGFVVVIDALLWVPTFVKWDIRFKELITASAIAVNAPDGVHGQPDVHEPDYFELVTVLFTDQAPKGSVAWWIILLSVLGGILLLVLIVLCLYKCGFFKRPIKDEYMQKAANL